MLSVSRVLYALMVIAGCWLAVLSAAVLLLAGANELLGLGWWAEGYPAIGDASFGAFALEFLVLGLAGVAVAATALAAGARSPSRADPASEDPTRRRRRALAGAPAGRTAPMAAPGSRRLPSAR